MLRIKCRQTWRQSLTASRKRCVGITSLVEHPPVFDEFSTDAARIDPIRLLLGWRTLGPDAASDQQKYLDDLFVRRPTDLNWFLKFMFRIEFLDDYLALKPLIDYSRLAELIEGNKDVLDKSKVEEFTKRYVKDQAETQQNVQPL